MHPTMMEMMVRIKEDELHRQVDNPGLRDLPASATGRSRRSLSAGLVTIGVITLLVVWAIAVI